MLNLFKLNNFATKFDTVVADFKIMYLFSKRACRRCSQQALSLREELSLNAKYFYISLLQPLKRPVCTLAG